MSLKRTKKIATYLHFATKTQILLDSLVSWREVLQVSALGARHRRSSVFRSDAVSSCEFPSNAKACNRHEKFKHFTGAQQWVTAISVDQLFHLSRAKLQKNPPRRSPTVWVRARAFDRLVDPSHRCCRLSSFAPRVSTESCHVRMNSCR